MPDTDVRGLNDFARERHPGLVGVQVLSVEPDLVTGRARPVHRGRTTQVWDVEVHDEANGKVIALFLCTQMVLRADPGGGARR